MAVHDAPRTEPHAAPRTEPYTAVLFKFVVLVGLLYMPVLVFHLGTWFPFAGASAYLLWELGRLHRAYGEVTGRGDERRREGSTTSTI